MTPREYCHWLKGALDLGGPAVLAEPEGLARALKALPSNEAVAGERAESAFCGWLRGVAEASLSMEPPAGLSERGALQAGERLKAAVAPSAKQGLSASEGSAPASGLSPNTKLRC